eukprot:GFUD01022468.1.p1 GENE.GFUD01022468.1~~GFUD01022468.1.p1  ORF type:complete len:727 (-),score=304.86 GFUD01022468.1:132-2312(-)
MDTGFLNSLVADYMSSVSSKLAGKFMKETKSSPLPADSPKIADIVQHFKETAPKGSKKKLAMTIGGDSAAKKAKKDDSSSDDSDESNDDNKNKKPFAKGKPAKAAPVEKMDSSDDSDSEDEKPAAKPAAAKVVKKVAKKESSSEDSDSEDEKPAAKPAAKAATPAKPAPKAAAKKEESSSDEDSSDEEEEPAAKAATPAKSAPKAAAKKEESSSEDSSDEEEEKPAAKAAAPAKPAPKAVAKKEESSSEEDSSDEDEKPAAPAKAAPKVAAKKEESSSEEDSSDDEDEKPAVKKAAAPAAKPAAKKEESSSEDSDSDEDEKPAPKAAKPAAKAAKKESSDSDDSSDDDDEPAPKKAAKVAPAEPMDEDEPVMKVKSNKNKTLDDIKTPTMSHDQSYGGGDKSFSEEGRKIFIHNVSEEATYEDFQPEVEKHGEVTDFFNPGRGFGFITFSTNEEAQACIKAMDNTEISGRTIQMNIARPKGEKPAPGTGGKRQEAPEGCKLFVHGITQETDNPSLQAAFEVHGNVTDAYNPGKGFAFVTYSKPAEAKAAMEAMEGTEVCGCYVTINVAKPRGGGDAAGGRGGARGGRGGGGGGGGRREDIEGAKLFVHNVSEDTAQEDLWSAFAEHGTVTDAYNPGRGFAFVTFGSAEDAQKAMAALEGQEVCGREIQCNVAKPREAKNDGGGRGGGRGGARGGARGGRGGARGGRGGMSISAGGGGGNNKKISFD